MSLDDALSSLQKMLSALVRDEAQRLGLQLQMEEYKDSEEPNAGASILLTIPRIDVQIWLYQDEANIVRPGIDKRFEKWDYRDTEQLGIAVAEEIRACFRHIGS